MFSDHAGGWKTNSNDLLVCVTISRYYITQNKNNSRFLMLWGFLHRKITHFKVCALIHISVIMTYLGHFWAAVMTVCVGSTLNCVDTSCIFPLWQSRTKFPTLSALLQSDIFTIPVLLGLCPKLSKEIGDSVNSPVQGSSKPARGYSPQSFRGSKKICLLP